MRRWLHILDHKPLGLDFDTVPSVSNTYDRYGKREFALPAFLIMYSAVELNLNGRAELPVLHYK